MRPSEALKRHRDEVLEIISRYPVKNQFCATGKEREMKSEIRSRNFSGSWPKMPGRLFGTGFVRLYQLTLSGFIGNSCRHFPTCSEYTYEAIARHGLWRGGWMGLFRVVRCGPGGTHGVDLVPDRLDEDQVWWAPWRFWRISRKRGET